MYVLYGSCAEIAFGCKEPKTMALWSKWIETRLYFHIVIRTHSNTSLYFPIAGHSINADVISLLSVQWWFLPSHAPFRPSLWLTFDEAEGKKMCWIIRTKKESIYLLVSQISRAHVSLRPIFNAVPGLFWELFFISIFIATVCLDDCFLC